MKSAWRVCAILLMATAMVAQSSTPSKPKKAKAPAVSAADVQALKDAIAAQQAALTQQQQQIQDLRDELHRKDQAVQQAQSAATDAAGKADAAQAAASQDQQSVTALKSDVTDLKTGMVTTVQTLQETQKSISDPPSAIHVKGITITPGGFLAAETVRRSRALGGDINTPLNTVPLPFASQSRLSEFFGSGRQSRISMLAEGRLKDVKVGGYVEGDFLSAGVTSNNNQSNSYTFRQRQAWAQAAFDSGWTVTGGQMWSLVTETRKGLDNRAEALPMTIDPQYTVGFSWARQYGLRVAKNFNNKVWFGVSAEDASATLTSHGGQTNFIVGQAGVTSGLFNNQSNYSFNPSLDVIAKLAFEPGFGHYEVFGIYSRFRDRIFPCAELASGSTTVCNGVTGPSAAGALNNSKNGGGIGANARWSFANKHLDFGLHGLTGNGVGRYGTSGLPDASTHGDGSLALIRSYQGLATIEWHGPKLDVYLNAGSEYAGRQAYLDPVSGKNVGYGNFNNSNATCYAEVIPGSGGFSPGSPSSACNADTRVITEGTVGFWYRFYNGPKGRIQWGPQFSYINRSTWADSHGLEPHGVDGMIFTSFRYYLP